MSQSSPTATEAWAQLAQAAQQNPPLTELLTEPGRDARLCHTLGQCRFDFSKQHVALAQLEHLYQLADEQAVAAKRDQLLAGEKINRSEDRAVLHTALRGTPLSDPTRNQDISAAVDGVLQRTYALVKAVQNGDWRGHTGKRINNVVHIGIGGSHLGPQLVTDALAQHARNDLSLHYVANIDAFELEQALARSNPETTLFVIASKSFTTLETQINASSARSWFLERGGTLAGIAQHFVAVTNNIEAAARFGLPEDNLLPMWDWVGGRFSLWSAVGLPIALKIGCDNHAALLAGAKLADEHFASADLGDNVPMLMALLATWNYNFLGATSLALLCYDERLKLLPNFLQQLEMESNGKSVDLHGQPVDYHTMAVLWGGTGTNGQHAYHQLLHQGTRAYAADFVMVGHDDHRRREHHNWLSANAMAQSQAMAQGFQAPEGETHRSVAGNHSSTIITLDELGPHALGVLLAVYEHKVFCQAAIWNINAFDQWGVELGKNLAVPIYGALTGDAEQTSLDPSTTALIKHLKKNVNRR